MSAIAKLWAEIGGDASGLDRALKHVDSGMRNAERSVGRSASGIDQAMSTAFGFALSNVVLGGISSIAGGIADLGRQAIDVVGNFERLEFSLSNMVATEIQNNFKDTEQGIISMAEAMEKAGPQVKDLVGWMETFAAKSPYAMKDVSESFRLGMTYFGKTDKVKRITKATMDYATVLGLNGFEMSKIVRNLGQMHSMNKLTMVDINELAKLGMPVYRILADKFGATTEAVKEMIDTGIIPAQDAVGALIDYMEEKGGGASDKFANSISGVVSALSDIKEYALRDFFTPIFEAVRPYLSGFVDWFLKPETREAIKNLGTFVADTFKNVSETISSASWFKAETLWTAEAPVIEAQTTALEQMSQDPARQEKLKTIGTNLGGLVAEGLLSFIRGDTVSGEGFWGNTAIDDMARALIRSVATRIEMLSSAAGEIWIAFVLEFAEVIGKPLDSRQSKALNDNFKLLFNALDPVDLAGYVWQLIAGGLTRSAQLGTSLGQLLSRDSGGWIPGPEGKPRLMIGHGQEYVLPSNQARTVSNNYNFDMIVNTQATSSSVIQDYYMLRSLAGVA